MTGILITRGSKVVVPEDGFSLAFDAEGKAQASMTLHVSYEMYPQWLRIAVDHAAGAATAAAELDGLWTDGSGEGEIDKLEAELRSGMQAFVAAGAAIDGFYAAVKDRCPLPDDVVIKWNRRRPARHIQVLTVFQNAFAIGPKTAADLQGDLKTLFDLRNEAVHPSSTATEPLPHPRLGVATERRLSMFRAENAQTIARNAIAIISGLIAIPKPENEALREHCEFAQEWLEPIMADANARIGGPSA